MAIPYGSNMDLDVSYPESHALANPTWVPYRLASIHPIMSNLTWSPSGIHMGNPHIQCPILFPYGPHMRYIWETPHPMSHIIALAYPIWVPHRFWTCPTQIDMPMLIPFGSHICLNISYPQRQARGNPIWVPHGFGHVLPRIICPC